MVFSATGKLFEYSNSSMEQVIERRNLHPKNTDMSGQPSHELQAREGRRPTRIELGRTPETRKIIGNKLVSCRRRKGDGIYQQQAKASARTRQVIRFLHQEHELR